MKKALLFPVVAVVLFQVKSTQAQCNFKPTVTPSTLVFCAYAADTLATQEYDSYQWLKNNKPIEGATHRKLILQQQNDQGYYYSVIATKNGCMDTSKRVFADGWAFNPPILIEDGDIGVYNPNLDALVECPKDTLNLTLGLTYTVNIQWYNRQTPINGANQQSYNVVHNGSYTVCGAPAVCPNFIQCESLPLNVVFENPDVSITNIHDTLFASGKKNNYQWYINGSKIEGANEQYYAPGKRGFYTVVAYDKYTCKAVSRPFFYNPDNQMKLITVFPNPVVNVMHIHINSGGVTEIVISDLTGNTLLKKPVPSRDVYISLNNLHAGTYAVQAINRDKSVAGSVTILKQ